MSSRSGGQARAPAGATRVRSSRKKVISKNAPSWGALAPLPRSFPSRLCRVLGLVRLSGSYKVSCFSGASGCQSPGEGARMQGPMG